MKTGTVFTDASCLIDLRKGNLLQELHTLPYRFKVPSSVKKKELLDRETLFQPWEKCIDRVGIDTYEPTQEELSEAMVLSRMYSDLSGNDSICLAIALNQKDSILLTGDNYLRKVAKNLAVSVHGVIWIVDELKSGNRCSGNVLIQALNEWKSDPSVFLPEDEIDKRIRLLN